MKISKPHLVRRLKAGGLALFSLLAGLGLLAAKQQISRPLYEGAAVAGPRSDAASGPGTTQPAEPAPEGLPNSRQAAAASMASLVFMFSLMCFLTASLCVGWIIWDIRRSRPAWKTQTRYPRRRP